MGPIFGASPKTAENQFLDHFWNFGKKLSLPGGPSHGMHENLCKSQGRLSDPNALANLSAKEQLDILDSALAYEKAVRQEELMNLDDIYNPDAWVCSECGFANNPDAYKCLGFIKMPTKFQECKGTQATSWGGFKRICDKPPGPGESRRSGGPVAYRRKDGGGTRRLRRKAFGYLTEAERMGLPPISTGDPVADKARREEVAVIVHYRDRIRDARHAKTEERRQTIRKMLEDDEGKWPCPNCWLYTPPTDNHPGYHLDTYNFWHKMRCWKCSYAKPRPENDREAYR